MAFYSVDILLVFSSFLASLHWPQGTPDLGKFGISYFELLMMFEVKTGHRLHTEKAVRAHLRPGRPLRMSVFLHSLFRAFGHLPGGFARFFPCQLSAHYARLSRLGWGRYGHGLSLLALVRVVTISFSLPFFISLVIRMEQLQSFLMAL